MSAQMDRIEWKLDQLLMLVNRDAVPFGSGAGLVKEGEKDDSRVTGAASRVVVLEAMDRMTTKQHAALQMVVAGATDKEIAERFRVTTNTAKVYVRTLAGKLGVNRRSHVVRMCLPVMQNLDESRYLLMSGGLPLNWNAEYDPDQPDPYWGLYGERKGPKYDPERRKQLKEEREKAAREKAEREANGEANGEEDEGQEGDDGSET